jgi:hypothetical protein
MASRKKKGIWGFRPAIARLDHLFASVFASPNMAAKTICYRVSPQAPTGSLENFAVLDYLVKSGDGIILGI